MKRRVLTFFAAILMICRIVAAEPITIEADLESTQNKQTVTIQTEMNPEWFNEPGNQYQHSLAKLSIVLSMAAFRDNREGVDRKDHFLLEFLEKAGFEKMQSFGYEDPTGMDTVSNAIAQLTLEDDQGTYVLLAVPVCGQGYSLEWMSNFYVENEEIHMGFEEASTTVYERLLSYIEENGLSGQRIKIWGTGFSRGAAVCNLLGDKLLQCGLFEQNNIFIYTFGSPNTTENPIAWPQIFNICGGFDPVPRIPFAEWGYGKHGVTLYLSSKETDPDYQTKVSAAEEIYKSLIGELEGFGSYIERNWFVSQVLDIIYCIAPRVELYTTDFQNAIIEATGTSGSLWDKFQAFYQEVTNTDMIVSPMALQVVVKLAELTESIFYDLSDLFSDNGGHMAWLELLLSGKEIIQEHYPEGYLAWLFSSEDPWQLYDPEETYLQLYLPGQLQVTITSGDEVLVSDDVSEIPQMQLRDQSYYMLSTGREYEICLKVKKPGMYQVDLSLYALQRVSALRVSSFSLFLSEEDEAILLIPSDSDQGIQVIQWK